MDWTREDLENKSKEELIDIIMNIQEDLEYFPDLYDDTYNDYEEQEVRREISLLSPYSQYKNCTVSYQAY